MQLIRLIYASTVKKDVDVLEVHKIHKLAHEKNALNFVSGTLAFGEGFFMQCLEGDRDVVNSLFGRIMADVRHERVVIYEVREVSQRSFEGWSMKLVLLTDEKQKIIFRHSNGNVFNPYDMSADSALQFLVEISSQKIV